MSYFRIDISGVMVIIITLVIFPLQILHILKISFDLSTLSSTGIVYSVPFTLANVTALWATLIDVLSLPLSESPLE